MLALLDGCGGSATWPSTDGWPSTAGAAAGHTLYILHPTVAAETLTADFSRGVVTPNQLRWRPFAIPEDKVDFVTGLFTICGSGR